MATVQIEKDFAGKMDTEIFEAAREAIINAGYQVWKTRELARLVMGKCEVDGMEVRLNVIASMVDSSATISAESDDLGEQALAAVVEAIKAEMVKLLAE